MRYIIAHDIGTSGNKATLFSEDGMLQGSITENYPVHFFNGNRAEQDAEDWWRAVCKTTRELIRTQGTDPSDIAVISFSGQMMGCLLVDRNGRPLRPSIIWADQRAVAESEALNDKISQWDIYRITGHRNIPSYGIQKLMWIKNNEPEVYDNTYKFLNAKDYIVFRLTGNFYTDYSDANSTGCFDINRLDWSERILGATGIPADKLPECRPSTFQGGWVTKEASEATGLMEGTPVVLGAGDGVTANVGAGSISEGKTYVSLGTSAWITTTTDKPVFDPEMRIVNWVHAIPGLYAPNGTMQAAGASYSWAGKQLCSEEKREAASGGGSPYDIMNRLVEKSRPGAGGVFFLPYLLGERAPRWDPFAKGAFIGLTAESTKGDLLRSILEGVAMNLSVCLDILKSRVSISEITAVGGGAKGEIWRSIMADVFDTDILVPDLLEEGGSMGAAVIGGVGAGVFSGFDAVSRFFKVRDRIKPAEENVTLYRGKKIIFDRLYEALKPLYPEL
ncbi:MAG: xylulokinase [Lachnospiraceae bacterium]|nr:xylulokinase [Lachnospiraceae bacterium]